jgi:L-malate glycosyltransferase
MRILWLVNNVFPDAAGLVGAQVSNTGWWLVALARRLASEPGVSLTIATETGLVRDPFAGERDGVRYVLLPEPWRAKHRRALGILGWDSLVDACARLAEDERPDVVVIHGTEFGYGLVTPRLRVPALVSLQGILNPYYPHYWGELKGSWRRWLYLSAMIGDFFYRQRMPHERSIIAGNRHFLGRTDWDRAHMRAINPTGAYFHEDRVLRPEFHEASWNLAKAERGRIYTTTTPAFLKGTTCLIDAMALVRQTHPAARLVIGGPIGTTGVGAHIRRRVHRLGLGDHVEFVGYLSGDKIVENLQRAHAYVIPSYIENSPNNLAEAQAVGVPCVGSYAGGIPSMIEHGRTGLLFNVGDAAVLAERIRAILDDDDLVGRLSVSAREVAARRHDPGRVVSAHLAACRAAIAAG